MERAKMDISYLDEIIASTINAVEKGKSEIYEIFEHAKQECERLEVELNHLKRMVAKTVEKVDNLVKKERRAKVKLMRVSREFNKYSEEDIKYAYEYAKDIQIELSLERQREAQLRDKRDEIERNYRSMLKILNQAEGLMYQIGAALGFLKGNLQDVSIQLLDMEERRDLAGKIIKAQEEERKRVARDIHDGPAQTLANIIIQTEICERLLEKDKREVKKELRELRGIVRNSLRELRKIIFDLRPSSLDDLGLEAVTRRYCQEFEDETNIRTNFKFFGDKTRLDSDIETSLFRIIQEGLTNVKKHSKANNVTIKLEFRQDVVNLSIVDDGIGFEWKDTPPKSRENRFGIMTIEERTSLLNGTFKLKSSIGKGTKIFTSIPIDKFYERGDFAEEN